MTFFLFLKFLEDISPFCGFTDTAILDFWRCPSWISKPEWIQHLTCILHHLCKMDFLDSPLCDTWWPLGSQHCSSQAFLTHILLHISTSIGGTWTLWSSMPHSIVSPIPLSHSGDEDISLHRISINLCSPIISLFSLIELPLGFATFMQEESKSWLSGL